MRARGDLWSNRPRSCHLTTRILDCATSMKKRKSRLQNKTLTKIDPSILRPKPLAISQHTSSSCTPVTTTINPVQPSFAPPSEPTLFEADPSSLAGDCLSDEGSDSNEGNDDEDNVARGYYAGRVCNFRPVHFWCLTSVLGQSPAALEGRMRHLPSRTHPT